MLRILGGCMMLGGCLGMGLLYRRNFLERLRVLRELLHLLERMESEVRCRCATLPECCLRVGRGENSALGEALVRAGERQEAQPAKPFPGIFEEELGAVMEAYPLTEQDRRDFFAAVGAGEWDVQAQEQCLSSCRETLLCRVAALEDERENKCRMALGLGIMSGIFLVLILW